MKKMIGIFTFLIGVQAFGAARIEYDGVVFTGSHASEIRAAALIQK